MMNPSAPSFYELNGPSLTQPLQPSHSAEQHINPPSKCRDSPWAFLFLTQLIGLIALAAYLFNHNHIHFANNPTSLHIDNDVSLLFCSVLLTGVVMSIGWLLTVKAYASQLIKLTLGLGIAVSLFVLLISLFSGNLIGLLFGLLTFLAQCVYVYLVRDRIPFASALLSMSVKPIQLFRGTIGAAFAGIVVQAVWTVVWVAIVVIFYVSLEQTGQQQQAESSAVTTSSYLSASPSQFYNEYNNDHPVDNWYTPSSRFRQHLANQHFSLAIKQQLNPWPVDLYDSSKPDSQDDAVATIDQYSLKRRRHAVDTSTGIQPQPTDHHHSMKSSTIVVLIGLLLSFYWISQVIQNVVHCSISGVVASWYFIYPNPIHRATLSSLKRATTTSFGSICLGSLILSVIRVLKTLVEWVRRKASEEHESSAVQCVLCLLSCIISLIDSIVEYVNQYAFAYLSIFGTSYCESAKATFDLLQRTMLLPVINDSLIGGVLTFGSLLGGAVCALVSALLAAFVFHLKSNELWIGSAIVGFLVGFAMLSVVGQVIESAVITLLICYAENPDALKITKPAEFYRLQSTVGMRLTPNQIFNQV